MACGPPSGTVDRKALKCKVLDILFGEGNEEQRFHTD